MWQQYCVRFRRIRERTSDRNCEAWTVAKLHTEPLGGKPIKRSDSIVSLVFMVTVFVMTTRQVFNPNFVQDIETDLRKARIRDTIDRN